MWQKNFLGNSNKMVTNINQIITRSLHKQLDQIAMQHNEEENVIKGKTIVCK
jgi:hypothetical protein